MRKQEKNRTRSKKRKDIRCCCPSIITGPMGSTGPTGPRGENGRDGASDTITIRNNATGEAGNDAQVINTTGSPNHVLDFIIPRGLDGSTGPQGLPGIMGPTGPQGLKSESKIIFSPKYGNFSNSTNQSI